jgi:hypothetical protein
MGPLKFSRPGILGHFQLLDEAGQLKTHKRKETKLSHLSGPIALMLR